jgi:hypothetical protein
MTKIDLQNIAFTDSTSTLINANSFEIETKSDTFLSRDGATPNEMLTDLDMNSNQIFNLPTPSTPTEPLRAQDLASFISGSLTIPDLQNITVTTKPLVNDGVALGSTTKSWSDLFLANGAVFNFNNGNLTVTHNSGTLTFTGSILGGNTISKVINQTFTSGGTYTPTTGMLYCDVVACGGGGGGGGTPNTSAAQISAGGGGGSGGVTRGIFTAAQIGASKTVTIGAAGTTGSNAAGGNGGNTTFGALLTANGGQGGPVGTATGSSFIFGGAVGGTASGGFINIQGRGGEDGWGTNPAGQQLAQGGIGGYTPFGLGTGGAGAMSGTGAQIGNGATGFGGGGGGSAAGLSSSATSGGGATAGIVFVIEYVQG